MSELLGVLLSLAVLVAGIMVGLQERGALPWGGILATVLVVCGGLGLLYFLVVGAGRRSDERRGGRSS